MYLPPATMMKSVVAALLLVTAASALSAYPFYKAVVRSPRDYDELYSSSSGPVNESWTFDYPVTLMSVIIPSQISDPLPSGTYDEAIDLFLYETRLVNFWDDPETYLVATGSFSGPASYGQELEIPLRNATIKGPPKVGKYYSNTNGFQYTLNIAFKKTGTYPWYTDTQVAAFTPLQVYEAGISIGITNTDS